MLDFQTMIQKLSHYWIQQGCALVCGFDAPMGAGTFHPATFLQALGPEPSKRAYVQPSRRPTDGRYGNNPNRLQQHHQFQVILKPAPSDLQELYLGSLAALGLDLKNNDVRFVEDNWESPTLGAWGLGWEVWLNGMEITQFTYFQQVGGQTCAPITGELTYGLERLIMPLQHANNIYDVIWSQHSSGTIHYRDLFLQNEQELSAYNFEHADVPFMRTQFDALEQQAQHLLHHALPLPAYEHVLHLSHLFNVLDARGALSVNERQRCILRVRTLAQGVAEAYLATREALGFPLAQDRPSL